jgi:hypothetical protein
MPLILQRYQLFRLDLPQAEGCMLAATHISRQIRARLP